METLTSHDDAIKWKHFPRYWPFVRGIHRSPVNSPHKGQWRGALMFFYLRLNKWLSKQWWGWWFETLSCPLWRHRNVVYVCVSCFDILICQVYSLKLSVMGVLSRQHIEAVTFKSMFLWENELLCFDSSAWWNVLWHMYILRLKFMSHKKDYEK